MRNGTTATRNGKRKLHPHTITFQQPQDLEVYVLGSLGRNNESICAATGLSPGQVEYRLRKARDLEGFSKGQTIRRAWRDGSSFAARQAQRQLFLSIEAHGRKVLPPAITHPTPKIIQLRAA